MFIMGVVGGLFGCLCFTGKSVGRGLLGLKERSLNF